MCQLLTRFRTFSMLAVLLFGGHSAAQTASLSDTGLTGTVKSSDGKPLEGISVSAKAQGSTITTSVYTNQNGEYYFPPLPKGQYRIWAQAVGFELTRTEDLISSGKKFRRDFALKPFQDAWRQLSDAEWFASLPDDTLEDRKMKRVLLYNCGTCHNSGFALEKRFDKAGWEMIVNGMSKISGYTDPPDGPGCCGGVIPANRDEVPGGGKFAKPMLDDAGKPIGAERRVLEFYKKDIIAYLTKVRGPEPFPLKLNLIPRATGEAADIVVTEYDIPDKDGRTIGRLDPKTGYITQYRLTGDGSTVRNDEPEYDNNEFRDGSDWSTGLRSRLQVYSQHDLVVGKDGYVYFPPAIGVGLDPEGNVWCSFGNEMAAKFDVKTEKIASFPLPKGWATFNNGKDVDSKGNFWAAQPNGTYRLDPKTGQYTEFKAKTQLGRPYGLTIDSEDNVWIAQIAVDKVGYVDGNTGEVGEVVLPPIDDEDISAADRELGRGWDLGQPLYAKGPRRLRADRKGDTVWVSEYFAGRLAKIDIHTKKLTEYKLPALYRYANVYEPVVDKNHMVWFSMTNQDALGRFNPVTEKFTFYPTPTRGISGRHIDVDNNPQVPEIWLPYDGASKVARVQFRTRPAR
jgi:virginiamycin B lyase